MLTRPVQLLALIGMLALASCGSEPPRSDTPSAPECVSDEQCREAGRNQCPGGSVSYAECRDGSCQFGGCSSPIGTPCDDDPATQFDDESCP